MVTGINNPLSLRTVSKDGHGSTVADIEVVDMRISLCTERLDVRRGAKSRAATRFCSCIRKGVHRVLLQQKPT